MNKDLVLKELQEKYPTTKIICLPEENPTEIICEVDPENGVAIAVIDESAPHKHLKTNEHYRVMRGHVHLFVEGDQHMLQAGDFFDILPEQEHHAIGEEAWVEVTSKPPWSAEDHILV